MKRSIKIVKKIGEMKNVIKLIFKQFHYNFASCCMSISHEEFNRLSGQVTSDGFSG